MRPKGIWYWLGLAIVILVLGIAQMFLNIPAVRSEKPSSAARELALDLALPTWVPTALPGAAAPDQAPSGSVLSSQVAAPVGAVSPARSLTATGDVIEVFTNTWSYSTLGLVYDPGRDRVRYAHESQSSTHNPTIYDVDRPSHTVAFSLALSTANSGWPWQIDNRDGAGYDFVADTYFLPDYNGDLSYSDDNIVEVNSAGVILNAWEMDDEVGSNDSSDGSEVDNIIDIAVVPGSPPRYFVTAAYDDAVVYEIALLKTGVWWAPDSWHTVVTYTLPVFTDNLGIDWDAEHEVFFHSGWHTTTILITDLGMNPVTQVDATFDCPGAGGYNSGVAYIEGSDPTEVWVTDFSSDATTRCETPFAREAPPPVWGKWVDGQPWDPALVVDTQTEDVVQITDVITAVQPFTLTEAWDVAHLELLDVEVLPPVGTVITAPGSLQVVMPAGPPEVVTVHQLMRVRPCDWTDTILEEVLVVEDAPPFDPRPVAIHKRPAELHLTSAHDPEAYAGDIATFRLDYSNTGGYENDVKIRNEFPDEAPFVYAEPFPDEVGPQGSWVRWDLGDLAQSDAGSIDVYVLIDEVLVTSDTVTIWDGIFDHMDVLRDETFVGFHVNEADFPVVWEKRVNEVLWEPDLSVTLETSQTLRVDEIITPPDPNGTGYSLVETWNPEDLELLPGWIVDPDPPPPAVIISEPGLWVLEVPPGLNLGPVHIIKDFHALPCNWPETVLWEELHVGPAVRSRPVVVAKLQPALWIDSAFDPTVYGGGEAVFSLNYGNARGFESQAVIRNEFPPQAPFLDSNPRPDEVDPEGLYAIWNLGPLATDDTGSIDVAVRIEPGLPPSSTIEIWDGILDHAGVLEDETLIRYHVPPPTWEKWVDDMAWHPGLELLLHMSDTIAVTDVISTRSAVAMVEHWNPEHLGLEGYTLDPPVGIILEEPGFLSWEFRMGAPGTITLTKLYHVESGAWAYTVLWEELWVEGVEWERRPVHIDKRSSFLYLPLVLRGYP